MINSVIFDWSGTLVDDLPAVFKASNFVFRQAGIAELSLEEFRREFTLPFKNFYDRYLPHVPMAQLETWFHSHFKVVQDDVLPLPHAAEFLNFCRLRQWRLFVLSSVHRDHFARQSEETGLGGFFEKTYLEAWDKRSVIHPLLKENGLEPGRTLYIGDMQHDVETAKVGGVHSCAVLTGYNDAGQLKESAPDLLVENLRDLQTILEGPHPWTA